MAITLIIRVILLKQGIKTYRKAVRLAKSRNNQTIFKIENEIFAA